MDNNFNLDYLNNQLLTKQIATTTRDRLQLFMQVLQQPIIDLKQLQQLSSYGIPDDLKGLRSIIWKLLMGYLPVQRNKWRETIIKNQEVYEQFCNDFIKSKLHKQLDSELDQHPHPYPESETEKRDHPLSNQRQSHWKGFFEDQAIWEEVEKDTIRTRAELSFFVSPTQTQNKFPVYFRTQCRRERRQQEDFEHRHFDVLTRILFIYAKLNPAIRYVQGMNEILAPFYYVFHSDVNEFFKNSVESDCFFCFTMFMSDAKESFIRYFDESQDGIKSKMSKLDDLMRVEEWDVWNNLQKQGIHPQFYSLRWIMLYLTQEFELHCVFRLWDSLLSKKDRNQYLLFLCLGIVREIKPQLLQNDFTDIMESFKIYDCDIDQILMHANQIYYKYQ